MSITQNKLLAAYRKVATLSDDEVRQVLLADYSRKVAFTAPPNLKKNLLKALLMSVPLTYGAANYNKIKSGISDFAHDTMNAIEEGQNAYNEARYQLDKKRTQDNIDNIKEKLASKFNNLLD